jgi:Beta-lactamase enzyme family
VERGGAIEHSASTSTAPPDDELAALRRRCEESARRSRSRRRSTPRRPPARRRWPLARACIGLVGILVGAGLGTVLVGDGQDGGDRAGPSARYSGASSLPTSGVVHPYRLINAPVIAPAGAARFPTRGAIAAARGYARSRAGLVSFAVVDSRGAEHGFAASRSYVSASVVKVMLLAAELDRLQSLGQPLDLTTRGLLSAMITYSDNAAADAIYARVGDEGLIAVARRAQLRDFTVSGYWANAQLTARDMARLMARLDVVLTGPDADFAAGLLTAITADQRWGIPEVAPAGWRLRFKGGWRGTERGQLVHQIARLERGRRVIALAVLTDAEPTMVYGIETVRGIAARLFTRSRGRDGSTRG